MKEPVLYRKRLIPQECICLKDDEIIFFSDTQKRLVTKWHAIRPRKDLHHGYSAYFWDEGFKVSKFYSAENNLLYWYCDIIDTDYDREQGSFVATDLLADVLIYPDGFVKVVDLAEITESYDKGLLSLDLMKAAINRLDHLLSLIYSGQFKACQDFLNDIERNNQ